MIKYKNTPITWGWNIKGSSLVFHWQVWRRMLTSLYKLLKTNILCLDCCRNTLAFLSLQICHIAALRTILVKAVAFLLPLNCWSTELLSSSKEFKNTALKLSFSFTRSSDKRKKYMRENFWSGHVQDTRTILCDSRLHRNSLVNKLFWSALNKHINILGQELGRQIESKSTLIELQVCCKWDLHDHKISCFGCKWAASAFYDLRSQTNTVNGFVKIAFYHLRANYGKQTRS